MFYLSMVLMLMLLSETPWSMTRLMNFREEAILEIYKRMRPGDPPALNQLRHCSITCFSSGRYDLKCCWSYEVK